MLWKLWINFNRYLSRLWPKTMIYGRALNGDALSRGFSSPNSWPDRTADCEDLLSVTRAATTIP